MQALSHFLPHVALWSTGMLWSALMFARAERAAGTLPGPHSTPRCAWAAAAALSALGASHADAAQFAAGCVSIALVAGAIGDVRSGFLFDAITLPACALALGAAIWLGTVEQAFAGVLLGAGSFGAAHVATRGRAVGLGDVKALYAVGAAFGALGTARTLAAASLSGLAFALVRGASRRSPQPFGPHLATGAAFALGLMGK